MVVTLQTVKDDMAGNLKSEDVVPSEGLPPNDIATGELLFCFHHDLSFA